MTAEQDAMRPAPEGLGRKERAAWYRTEGQRIAHETGVRPVLRAPAGLNRKARRSWRRTHGRALKRRNEAYTRDRASRQGGALVIAAALAVVLGVRVLIGGDSEPPAKPVPTTPTAAAGSTATSGAATDVAADALPAARAWFAVTCPLTPDAWQPAQRLMTAGAYAEAIGTAPAVGKSTWSCSDIDAVPVSGVRKDGTVIVRVTATRTVTPERTPGWAESAKDIRSLHQQGGQWLVGYNAAN